VSEDCVNAVQMWRRLGEDEELGAVRVRPLVGHGEQERPETEKIPHW
jgi:hypothetical protein